VDDGDKVLGLELGADDYVTKPFSPKELAARVQAVLRRAGQATPGPAILRAAGIELDRAGHAARVDGQAVHLTRSEFELLAALMAAPGRTLSRLDLLDRIQGAAFEGYDRTVDVHIKNLRAKLEHAAGRPEDIETIYGVGYRLRAAQA
jgi:DNA-binding response OmpR family regulator